MNRDLNSENQAVLIAALANPTCYPHPVGSVQHLETHISHILLAGDYAYKIKKPLNLGFLDFTSLERRRRYCYEEIRLNRRLAPQLYLDCIPLSGSLENPVLGGDPANALEYAVKMRRFSQAALLDRCLAEGRVQAHHFDALARQLAGFHGTIARVDPDRPWGTPAQVQQPVQDNFATLRQLLTSSADLEPLEYLEQWTLATYRRLQDTLAARRSHGFIRECHGDLHLGNMLLEHDRIVIFDCIEFNDAFRWIDVMSDLGFLLMDLHQRGAGGLAWRLLNGYLAAGADYGGLQVLPYYQVYRALVRAKIGAIRLHQPDLSPAQRAAVETACRSYLELAVSFTRPFPPFLLITHGVSGSGKSYLTAQLADAPGAVRIRSDVERKRLFGLEALENSHSGLGQGLYTADAGRRTYERLSTLAEQILTAGYPVLVDATFLEPAQRQVFRNLAATLGVPFILLACEADPDILRARVARRRDQGEDAAEADVAVLERQLQNYQPPPSEERPLFAAGRDGDNVRAAVLARLQEPGHAR
ncbi:MAG: AAA family ATPase [Candidatus Competibacteraceae bacterium]